MDGRADGRRKDQREETLLVDFAGIAVLQLQRCDGWTRSVVVCTRISHGHFSRYSIRSGLAERARFSLLQVSTNHIGVEREVRGFHPLRHMSHCARWSQVRRLGKSSMVECELSTGYGRGMFEVPRQTIEESDRTDILSRRLRWLVARIPFRGNHVAALEGLLHFGSGKMCEVCGEN